MTDQINISSTINNSPNQYFDQIISLRTVKTIEKLFNEFNQKNLLLLILLFGADFVKKELTNGLSTVYQSLKQKIASFEIKKLLINIWKKFCMFRKQESKILISRPPINRYQIKFVANNIFYENLCNFLQTSDNVNFNSTPVELAQIGKNEYESTIAISNISIYYEDIEISIQNIMNFKISISENSKKYKSCQSYLDYRLNLTKDSYDNIFELLPFPDFVKDMKPHLNIYLEINDSRKNNFIGFTALKLDKRYNLMCSTGRTYGDIYRLIQVCLLLNNVASSVGHREFLPVGNTINFLGEKINITEQMNPGDFAVNNGYNLSSITNIRQLDDVKKWFNQTFKINNSTSQQSSEIDILLESKNNNIDLDTKWLSFVKELNSKTTENLITPDDKMYDIKIFDTKLIKNKNVIQKASPKKTIKKKDEEGNEEEITLEAIDEIVETTTDIIYDEINSTYKDFSTLYLKKQDLHVLSTTLHNFKHKRKIYTDLGLPYKFGVLLHGPPGTGKSSAILAIASYLQKDIYYLDFNNIKTNNDLKAVFNKVNKEMSNNGIIVMEDIDVMTNIVHDRSLNHYTNDELTLECFLNLLQGSLTKDGSVFIATTNNIDILDPAFVRDGRFDVKINLTACDHFQMNQIYNKFFNRSIPKDLIVQIPELQITPVTFISKLTPYILCDVDDETIIENILDIE